MKFKTSLKYYLSDVSKALIIYYIVIYALLLIMGISQILFNPQGTGVIGGFEMASIIFIFVAGLNSFKSNFKMLLANGVSRVTMFKSTVVGILPMAGILALVDSINGVVLSSLLRFQTMFGQMYGARYAAMPATFGTQVQASLEGFLWMFFAYAAVAMLGFFITTLYYRMNKAFKLIVSIGVPVLIFVVLPYVDATLFHGTIFAGIREFIAFTLGFRSGCVPYIAMASNGVVFVTLGALQYLAMRRAQIKE